MALITIPKKKVAVVGSVAPAVTKAVMLSDFAEQIDEVGELQEKFAPVLAEIKALNAKLKPLKEAESRLQEMADEMEIGDDDGAIEHGAVYDVEIGAKGASRSIADLKAVRKMMGEELFFKVATVSLKDCDAYLTLPQRNQVIATTRAKRSFKVTKRA